MKEMRSGGGGGVEEGGGKRKGRSKNKGLVTFIKNRKLWAKVKIIRHNQANVNVSRYVYDRTQSLFQNGHFVQKS